MFKTSFQKVLELQKINLYFVLEFLEKSKKIEKLGDLLCSSLLSFTKSFPKYFSLSFCFSNSSFSTLELYLLSYLFRIFCLWKRLCLWLKETTSCKPLFLWGAPSLVEVEVVVYSLLVRWSWCLFGSLFGRGGL